MCLMGSHTFLFNIGGPERQSPGGRELVRLPACNAVVGAGFLTRVSTETGRPGHSTDPATWHHHQVFV